MTADERIEVKTATVGCDGGGDALDNPGGHPMVYLKIGVAGSIVCPYCSRQYVLSEDGATGTESGH